jgi:hypothetical protein
VNSQRSTIRTGSAILFEIAPMVTRFFYFHRENEGMSEVYDTIRFVLSAKRNVEVMAGVG